jgi:hypothetical protein
MVIDPQHEATLTEALRLLRDAKSLVDQISDETHERSGVQDVLRNMAKRISSSRSGLEKLVPRRSDWKLDDDPMRPKRPWGRRSHAANSDGPPDPPPPPPED